MPVLKSDYYKQFGSLNPCPCCGAPAEWHGGSSTPEYIKCSKCNLKYTGGSNLQKLADGWNARVERTCTLITEEGNNSWYLCTACYADIYMGYRPAYCPSCGAKVIVE